MESKKDVINKASEHGLPLQRYCSLRLQSLGWDVNEEFPVTFEYQQGSSTKQIESIGDIKAEKIFEADEFAIEICIESKKRQGKDWVFLRELPKRELGSFSFVDLCRVNGGTGISSYNIKFANWPGSKLHIATGGLELESVNEAKKEDDKIYATCKQLAFALRSVIEEDKENIQLEHELDIPTKYEQILYVPVIVTGADLHILDVDDKNFSLKENTSVSGQKIDYLLYTFSLPKYLWINIDTPFPERLFPIRKMNAFIVNYTVIEQFFRSLTQHIEGQKDQIRMNISNVEHLRS